MLGLGVFHWHEDEMKLLRRPRHCLGTSNSEIEGVGRAYTCWYYLPDLWVLSAMRASSLQPQLAKFSRISHSQKRSTLNPPALKRLVVRLSRSLFDRNFLDQYALFDFGLWPHDGHPCQKQPSTNTANLNFGK